MNYLAIVSKAFTRMAERLCERICDYCSNLKKYLIGENEADILKTFLKKKLFPETILSVCFDKKIWHQTIYNYIERERQLGGTLYRYLFFLEATQEIWYKRLQGANS